MQTNEVYSELDTINNEPHKWWHRRSVKIIGISVTILIVFAVTVALVLNFVVFAPTTNQQSEWKMTGNMSVARRYHTASTLANGYVLVVGGFAGASSLNSAELYNPSTGTWTTTESMSIARGYVTASTLANGLVLVAGGANETNYLNSAELYNPSTGTWTTTGSMSITRYQHTTSTLVNGSVLVAGGSNSAYLNSA
ncbi:unnamed protein product [Adineta steineri]|uniref:Uncharacterized protein n=1 Tax=Adineta steineri TaxID=433720 RepID=A0A819RV37_9BILA|nr:unnamed protein product [Adineta steineri]CAF1075305.1 unnamed protein product [Adineta steineri]CAF1079704.1 unnamed protein product [Adineta steineri]CAF3808881.1 unnamed protein product [Adineta steineri]CAF3911890.1 unnamed protein product [Adineta steineri]